MFLWREHCKPSSYWLHMSCSHPDALSPSLTSSWDWHLPSTPSSPCYSSTLLLWLRIPYSEVMHVCLSMCACLITLNTFWGYPCCHTWQESFVFEIWVVFLCHLFFICSTLDGQSLSIFFLDAGISAALNMGNLCLYTSLVFPGCMLSTGDCWPYGDGVLCLIVGEITIPFSKNGYIRLPCPYNESFSSISHFPNDTETYGRLALAYACF